MSLMSGCDVLGVWWSYIANDRTGKDVGPTSQLLELVNPTRHACIVGVQEFKDYSVI